MCVGDGRLPQAPEGGRETDKGRDQPAAVDRAGGGLPFPPPQQHSDLLMSLSASILTFPGSSKAFSLFELSSTQLTLLPAGDLSTPSAPGG